MADKLPIVVENLDQIAEPLRGAYVEGPDKKFRLNADVEDVSGLKAKERELLGKLNKAGERLKLLGERTDEEIQADFQLAQKAREEKAKAEGNFTAMRDQLVEAHNKALQKEKDERAKIEGMLYNILVTQGAERAIRDAGLEPEVLLPHVTPNMRVVNEDDVYVARVVDAKGNIRYAGDEGLPMTPDQLVANIIANPKFAGIVPASGVSGSGARNEGASGGRQASIVIIPKDASVQEYRRLKAEAEKRGVPYKVGD